VTRVFHDADAELGQLKARTIVAIGYGNQGRAQALNMRDSGVERVVVSSVCYQSWETAESDGFSPWRWPRPWKRRTSPSCWSPTRRPPSPRLAPPTKALPPKPKAKLSTSR
jgi:hypothetical protein